MARSQVLRVFDVRADSSPAEAVWGLVIAVVVIALVTGSLLATHNWLWRGANVLFLLLWAPRLVSAARATARHQAR